MPGGLRWVLLVAVAIGALGLAGRPATASAQATSGATRIATACPPGTTASGSGCVVSDCRDAAGQFVPCGSAAPAAPVSGDPPAGGQAAPSSQSRHASGVSGAPQTGGGAAGGGGPGDRFAALAPWLGAIALAAASGLLLCAARRRLGLRS